MSDIVGSGLAFWTDTDTADWDTLVLGGTVWPGIWEIDGEGVNRDIDLKKSKGSDKATLKDEGYKNGKLTAIGVIWTREQWRQLQAILPEIHPRKSGGERTALQLIHPQANILGVDSVYLTGIKIPKLDRTRGGPLTVMLALVEWTPEPKIVKKSSGGGGSQGGGCAGYGPYRLAAESLQKALLDYGTARTALAASPDDPMLQARAGAAESMVAVRRGNLAMVATQCPTPANKAKSGDDDEGLADEVADGLADAGEAVLDALDKLGDFI